MDATVGRPCGPDCSCHGTLDGVRAALRRSVGAGGRGVGQGGEEAAEAGSRAHVHGYGFMPPWDKQELALHLERMHGLRPSGYSRTGLKELHEDDLHERSGFGPSIPWPALIGRDAQGVANGIEDRVDAGEGGETIERYRHGNR